jgi:hypothetical protein
MRWLVTITAFGAKSLSGFILDFSDIETEEVEGRLLPSLKLDELRPASG